MCHEQWALTVIKLLKFFVLIFAVFLPDFIFDHVTVIVALTCCCAVPNFIEIGLRVRPPDAHNYRMFNTPLVGSGRCHGNRIMADMSGA